MAGEAFESCPKLKDPSQRCCVRELIGACNFEIRKNTLHVREDGNEDTVIVPVYSVRALRQTETCWSAELSFTTGVALLTVLSPSSYLRILAQFPLSKSLKVPYLEDCLFNGRKEQK